MVLAIEGPGGSDIDHSLDCRSTVGRLHHLDLDAAQREAGVQVNSVWDLVNTVEPYVRALPIPLDHVQRPYPDKVRESIARAMGVPEGNFAWKALVGLLRRDVVCA
jgi:hypothetical protein